MIDRLRLRDIGLVTSTAGLLLNLLGNGIGDTELRLAGVIVFCIGLVFTLMFFAYRPPVLVQHPSNIFNSEWSFVTIDALKNLYHEDEQFRMVVTYVYNLPPDDFLRFGRLMVELRDESNQQFMRGFSELFRKEDK